MKLLLPSSYLTASKFSTSRSHSHIKPPHSFIINPKSKLVQFSTKMATCIDNCRAYASYKCSGSSNNISFSSSFSSPHHLSSAYDDDQIWAKIIEEAESDAAEEPVLKNYYFNLILSHPCLESALANHLAGKLSVPNLLPAANLCKLFYSVLKEEEIKKSVRADLRAARDRDPACPKMAHCFLYYKGFLACQAHRITHWLWKRGRGATAFMIQSRVSEVFAVDIHPGATIGAGLLLDHAAGVVIGETAVVGDDVSMLHNVTLGGTGKAAGDRHPKVGDGVLVGAGSQILGNVSVGEGAKVGAGSVVLKSVPARTTAVGNPARMVGGEENPVRPERMAGLTMDHTSWSDYVI